MNIYIYINCKIPWKLESFTPSQVILSDRWQLRAKFLTFLIFPTFPSLRGRNRMGGKSPHPPSLGTLSSSPNSFFPSLLHTAAVQDCGQPPGFYPSLQVSYRSSSHLAPCWRPGPVISVERTECTVEKVLLNIHITGSRKVAQIHREVGKSDSFF